jgi:hypothetical protein
MTGLLVRLAIGASARARLSTRSIALSKLVSSFHLQHSLEGSWGKLMP